MEPIEHRLREAPLSRPSAAHDAAMQRIFAEAALRRPGFWALNVSMWQLVMACCICLAFGYLLHAYVEPQSESGPATSTVYVIPPDPALRGVFDTTPRRGYADFDPARVRVRVMPAVVESPSSHKGDV